MDFLNRRSLKATTSKKTTIHNFFYKDQLARAQYIDGQRKPLIKDNLHIKDKNPAPNLSVIERMLRQSVSLCLSHTCTQYITACPPINVTQGVCEAARDYQKRKNALRLKLPNGAEYLFVTRDETDVTAWVQAINSVILSGSATPSSQGTSAVSTPPLSQIRNLTRSVEPPPPSETVINGSSAGFKSEPMVDLPLENEPPLLPSAPLPDDEPVSEELPAPASAPAPVKLQPSPSLSASAHHGHHRPAPPPPPTSVAALTASAPAPPGFVAPPTNDESGRADKTGKRKSRFKMFGAKKS